METFIRDVLKRQKAQVFEWVSKLKEMVHAEGPE
jgi:hypothetical protein